MIPDKLFGMYREYCIVKYQRDEEYGHYSSERGVLGYEENQNPKMLANTLIHEQLHLVVDEMGRKLKDEETVVNAMANGLSCLMQNNQELWRQILEDLK